MVRLNPRIRQSQAVLSCAEKLPMPYKVGQTSVCQKFAVLYIYCTIPIEARPMAN